MSQLIMAMTARRLLALSIALVFLIGATAQLVPCGTAESDMGARAGMSAASGLPEAPAPAHTPSCLQHLGCAATSALPNAPASPPTALRWTSVIYDSASNLLAGLSVEPELSPPILAA